MKTHDSVLRRSAATPAPALFLVLLLAACGSEAPQAPTVPDSATVREIADGTLVGFQTDDGAHAWRGIPFATPPVGPLRWKAPRPPQRWAGRREAMSQGRDCVQFASFARGRDGAEPGKPTGSEDCLFLNVFAPPMSREEVARGDRRLPVMFWIHGGGNSIGSSEIYDGGALALRHDVIVVAVNYRLGVFGWFANSRLHREESSADDRSGNYGTLDLVRALEWVRENISSFGGDPDRVTIFGESAGGSDVYSLLLSPRAKGLFHRAISQSGSVQTVSLSRSQNFIDDSDPGDSNSSGEVILALLEAEEWADGRGPAKTLLAGMTNAAVSEFMRGLRPEVVISHFDGSGFGGMYFVPELIRDGWVLPAAAPLEALGDPRGYNQVPVMLGTNRDENKLFLMFGSDAITRLFQLPLWLNDEDGYLLAAEYQSNMWKAGGVDEPAAQMRSVQGPTVFAYRFDWDEQTGFLWLDLAKLIGASHAMEIPFVFGRLRLGQLTSLVFGEESLPGATKLMHSMTSYWANFAYTGDPGRGRDGKEPEWQPWGGATGREPAFILLDTAKGGGIRMSSEGVTREALVARVVTDPRFESWQERCELYYGFVEWSGGMTRDEYATIGDGACAEFPLAEYSR